MVFAALMAAMLGSVVFGDPQSPWGFIWDALAALGTICAVVVALGLHFYQVRSTAHAEREKRRLRTTILAPLLASDAMQAQWDLLTVMRGVDELQGTELMVRSDQLVQLHAQGRMTIHIMPGNQVDPSDAEWLTEDVRKVLSALKAQVTVSNAMLAKLAHGPIEPHPDRVTAVQKMLIHASAQVVDTNRTLLQFMEALAPFLPTQLSPLGASLQKNSPGFQMIHDHVAAVFLQENPSDRSGPE
ncbi:hypothetical protein [Pseudoxanthomonas wuyuanensis]